ncbi:MAG: NAD(P)-dependent dehydrogenase (short-subunit alcohol dehydrogenase family) [Candidatus Azotimanducaceae bacterium]|jgi:NAD(P)-dependent dehydrogenase (short-subunit alcohol dehydrogenase family)
MTTDELRYDGQVALVTGAGRGLGREHALLLASRGCKVIVNDPGIAYDGTGGTKQQIADDVVAEIRQAGGEATANYDSVEHGDAIIKAGMDAFGRIDIVINNAGIITPETWSELTLESWQKTININLTGVFSVMKAAWPVMVAQQYGRCVVTASPAIYGAGVAAYAASKAGVIGLANSLQFEAKKLKLDIKCNIIIPLANTRMVQDLNSNISASRVAKGKSELKSAPVEIMNRMAPEKVSAVVAWLAHADCQSEAKIFEAGAGHFAQLHWARSASLFVTEKENVTGAPQPEHIRDGQDALHDFSAGQLPRSGDGAMGSPSALQEVLKHLEER